MSTPVLFFDFQLLSQFQTHDKLSRRLSELLSGRENHAALVEVRAVRVWRDRVKLLWRDGFTGETGLLAVLKPQDAEPVIRTLFPQLRVWRRRCEATPVAPRAKAVGA